LGEIREDYDSVMIAAYLAHLEAQRGLPQSPKPAAALDEQPDPGYSESEPAIPFQALRRSGLQLP